MASIAALPTVATLVGCTDLGKTVYPYLHQLSLDHVLPLLRREVEAKAWYVSTNPLMSAAAFALALSVITFVAAEFNRNYSQVDRLWSILPALYTVHFAVWAHANGIGSERVDTMATLIVLWGARLTFNYWRRGGYQVGSEDYRWPVVKARVGPVAFVVLDLVFIAFIQNLLLLAVATPAYILLLVSRVPGVPEMTTADTMFSRGLVVVLILEALADQQQWNFQTAKHEYLATGVVPKGYVKEDLDRGFVVTGLWGLCRHPNFACEQAIWAGVYQWGCFQSDTMYNWTAVGVFVYLAVFQASTPLTEMITAEKYPEYKEYQRLVNKFVPGMNVFSGIADATTGSAEKIE